MCGGRCYRLNEYEKTRGGGGMCLNFLCSDVNFQKEYQQFLAYSVISVKGWFYAILEEQ
jgi:hypothetical protein